MRIRNAFNPHSQTEPHKTSHVTLLWTSIFVVFIHQLLLPQPTVELSWARDADAERFTTSSSTSQRFGHQTDQIRSVCCKKSVKSQLKSSFADPEFHRAHWIIFVNYKSFVFQWVLLRNYNREKLNKHGFVCVVRPEFVINTVQKCFRLKFTD